MTHSMTAYAQAATNTEFGELSCELRSVNHRYLEVAPKMPEELRVHEGVLREAVSAKLARGRVDCFIRLRENETTNLEPNPEVADNLHQLIQLMQSKVPSMQAISAIDVLRWPGVLQSKKIDQQKIQANLLSVLNEALDGLRLARLQEGNKLAQLLTDRLDALRQIIGEIKVFLPELIQQYRQRIEDKLVDIKDQLDPSRLEQEMIIFLTKTDVAEELDRLTVHIDEVTLILNKPEPCGRRLDFLMQELNREANTLGSKAQDPRLTKASVDVKVLIEQMREQVQNIE